MYSHKSKLRKYRTVPTSLYTRGKEEVPVKGTGSIVQEEGLDYLSKQGLDRVHC